MRAQDEQRRAVFVGHAVTQAALERVEVLGDFAELDDLPSVRAEPLGHVVGVGELGRTVDGDVVVVVDRDEVAELEVAGEGGGLVADAFHEVAVAADRERVVVAELGAEAGPKVLLGQRDAHGVADALTERPGGDLDVLDVALLGVAGRLRAPLAEVAQVLELETEAAQVEHRVDEHRRVTGRQHEAIAVGPVRIGRVVLHHAREQHVDQRREGHGCPGMSRVGAAGRRPSRGHARR